jgi:hypothetical protein
MLSEARDSDLLKDVETIAKGLADASGDLRYYWSLERYDLSNNLYSDCKQYMCSS